MGKHDDDRLGFEKRRHVRLDVELKVLFKLDGDPEDQIRNALTRDISHGGICLAIQEEKEAILARFDVKAPRLRISLQLTDPQSTLVETYASTAWLSTRVDWIVRPASPEKPILLGMAFENLDKNVADRIDDFIADRMIMGYK